MAMNFHYSLMTRSIYLCDTHCSQSVQLCCKYLDCLMAMPEFLYNIITVKLAVFIDKVYVTSTAFCFPNEYLRDLHFQIS